LILKSSFIFWSISFTGSHCELVKKVCCGKFSEVLQAEFSKCLFTQNTTEVAKDLEALVQANLIKHFADVPENSLPQRYSTTLLNVSFDISHSDMWSPFQSVSKNYQNRNIYVISNMKTHVYNSLIIHMCLVLLLTENWRFCLWRYLVCRCLCRTTGLDHDHQSSHQSNYYLNPYR